jgi:hypothetical protein
MDKYGFISNSSHGILDIRRYPKMLLIMEVIIFHTRLWNPDNHSDADEKERKKASNEFKN